METDWDALLQQFLSGVATVHDVCGNAERLKQDLTAKRLLTVGLPMGDMGQFIGKLERTADSLILLLDGIHRDGGGTSSTSKKKNLVRSIQRCHNIFLSRVRKKVIDGLRKMVGLSMQVAYGHLACETMGGLEEKRPAKISPTDVDLVFEDEEANIVKLLNMETPRRCVISIVGMGGQGKSSLAKKILNHEDVKVNFACRALVTVSRVYNLQAILSDIAEEAMGIQSMLGGEEALEKTLHGFLSERKYLVILDDVWNAEVLSHLLESHLPDVANGSRVMITTRCMNVAASADPSIPPYQLRLLTDDESWRLFANCFGDVAGNCPGVLKEQILKEYGGLPLSILAVGKALSSEGLETWTRMSGRIHIEESWCKRLSSSYKHMQSTSHRLCFLYLCCLPKVVNMDAEKLVCLWAAEGFLSATEERNEDLEKNEGSSSNATTMEQTGERILEDLKQQCMVQVQERYSYLGGHVMMVQLGHNVLRDVYIPQAEDDKFFHVCKDASSEIPKEVSRLTLRSHSAPSYMSQNPQTPKLVSLFGFHLAIDINSRSLPYINRLQLLKVLDLEDTRLDSLPEDIGVVLIHLRYLGLKRTLLKSIPSSVGGLQNLQTIDIRVTFIENLPLSLGKITTIRHIFVDHTVELRGIGNGLTNLCTLKTVGAGDWMDNNLDAMINLTRLAIKLIKGQHHTILTNCLKKLHHLRDLYLSGDSIPKHVLGLPDHTNLRVLSLQGKLVSSGQGGDDIDISKLPPKLEELNLASSKIQQDSWLLFEKLSNLKCLRLHNVYVGDQIEYSPGCFPQLERLYIATLHIKQWVIARKAMPCLTYLNIKACKELEKLPDGLQNMESLQFLEMHKMPDNFNERAQKEGADWDKIKHIPSISIDETKVK